MLQGILTPVLLIGGIGLLFGIVLGIAAKKFAVPVDEKVEAIRECLPGANCGGCGFAGCDAMAKSIASGESAVNGCPVCNSEQVEAISKVMGIEAATGEKQVAVVRCKGNHENAKAKFEYAGIQTCKDANLVGGGPKMCAYGCLGLGTCAAACQFGAIHMEDGLPVIDKEKCVGCGACQRECPRQVIHVLPISTSYHVNCVSKDKGKVVKDNCKVGCMGCGLCARQCENGAITVANNFATIDPEKCTGCGKCAAKCPTKAISNLLEEVMKQKADIPTIPKKPSAPNVVDVPVESGESTASM